MRTAQDVLATAGELADDVLFPDAMRVDRLDVLPAAHLDALAAAGLYGAPAPAAPGGRRGGIALTGLIPGPPQLRAEPAEGGWRLDGTAPWVTGWGLIDLVQVVARGPDNTVVTLIMDAATQPGLTMTRQRLP